MRFIDSIEAFISNIKEENESSTMIIYRRKIDVFYEFVTVILEANEVNFIYILTAMNLETLLESVAYYVKVGNVKSRATVDAYYFILAKYYKFIWEQYGWKNEYFIDDDKINELKLGYEKKVKELGLLEARQEEPVTDIMAENILKKCDQIINNVNIDEITAKKRGVYSNYISAIIVKFVLLYGLRNEVIKKLEIRDYDEVLNKITVNRYPVRLPDGLAAQMMSYKKIREIILDGRQSEKLFFNEADLDKELDNIKMFLVLTGIMGNNQARAVAKHAIVRMLKNGVPAHIIMDFTGYRKNVLDYCQDIVDEERGTTLLGEKCRILDSALRKNNLFDEM